LQRDPRRLDQLAARRNDRRPGQQSFNLDAEPPPRPLVKDSRVDIDAVELLQISLNQRPML